MTYSGGRRSSSFATSSEMASGQDDDRRPIRAPPGTPPLYKARSLSPGGANRYSFSRSATETREGSSHHELSPTEDHPARTRTSSPPAIPKGSHTGGHAQPTRPSSSPKRHKGAKPSAQRPCESPPMLEMSGSASTASLSPVPQRYCSGSDGNGNDKCGNDGDANKSREDAPASSASSSSPSPQVGRRSVSPRTVSPRGSNVSRIIAALQTVIPASQVASSSSGAAASNKASTVTTKVTPSGSDRDETNDDYGTSRGEATSPIEIGSTPHPSTVLRTVEPKRAVTAVSDSSSSSDGPKRMEAPGCSVGGPSLTSLTTLSSASSWRRPPPSPRAASKPRPVEPRYSPFSDSPMLETIDLPPEDDGLYGGFIPLSGTAGISNHQIAGPPTDVPDFGNISAISHDDASGESPVLVQVHRNTGTVEEEERDVPTELVKSRSNRTAATGLSETFSDPSTITEVTSNVTAAENHNLPAPTSPRFSRSAIMAQRSRISSRRISKSSGKSKRSTPAGPMSSPSTDRRRTPRRGSSTPPKPTSSLAASPRSKSRSSSTGRRARYGGSEEPTSDSDEESIDSQAMQETLDPMLVQYFLDLVLAEEGIVDDEHKQVGKVPNASEYIDSTDTDSWGGRSGANANPRMSGAEARSYAKALLDDHFGAGEKRDGTSRSPASVIVDFWRSFACDNLWQSNGSEGEGRPASGHNAQPGEGSSAFAAFDATFFQELWKELQAYKESCGSLSDVQDLQANLTRSRSETPATMATTTTDLSRGPSTMMGNGVENTAETRKYARSDIMSFCVPKDTSIGSKERSDLILQRCKQRFPLLYEKLVQRLEDERAKRKLGLLRRHDDPADSAVSTCTEEYTSGQDYSVESVDTSDNANDTPRTANRGTVTGAFQSVPAGFGVLRAPIAPKERTNLPPRRAPPLQGQSTGTQDSESTPGDTDVKVVAPEPKETDEYDESRKRETAGCQSLGATPPNLDVGLSGEPGPGQSGDGKVKREHAIQSDGERNRLREQEQCSTLCAKGDQNASEGMGNADSENCVADCIPRSGSPLEPILEAQGKTSLHPPDVVVRRSSATCVADDGFGDSESCGVHSNLTEEKKWADSPDNTKMTEAATLNKSKKRERQSKSVILTDVAEALSADRFETPCDDNDKSTASGKDILADLARMTDPATVREYSQVVRRSSRSRSGSRERPTSDAVTSERVQTTRSSPPTWEVFDSIGFDAPMKPRTLFRDEAKKEEQGAWEDFTASASRAPVVWPKIEIASVAVESRLLREESCSQAQPAWTSAAAADLQQNAVEQAMSPQQSLREVDREPKAEPIVKSTQRFSIVGRIRSTSASKVKSDVPSSSPSPRKGWLLRRSKPRPQVDEFDQSEWKSFGGSRYDCDASLATLDDAPTAALLQTKGSPTSVMESTQRLTVKSVYSRS